MQQVLLDHYLEHHLVYKEYSSFYCKTKVNLDKEYFIADIKLFSVFIFTNTDGDEYIEFILKYPVSISTIPASTSDVLDVTRGDVPLALAWIHIVTLSDMISCGIAELPKFMFISFSKENSFIFDSLFICVVNVVLRNIKFDIKFDQNYKLSDSVQFPIGHDIYRKIYLYMKW